MKNQKQISDAIKKLRIVIRSPAFSTETKDKAWSAMVALQWSRVSNPDFTLTILDLIGIPIDSQLRVKASAQVKK